MVDCGRPLQLVTDQQCSTNLRRGGREVVGEGERLVHESMLIATATNSIVIYTHSQLCMNALGYTKR